MLDKLAKDTYNKLLSMPPAERDLKEFAELVLKQFIEEVEKNQMAVHWNYSFDSVIFLDKSIDGKKSLKDIKEEYLGRPEIQISDSTVS